MKVFHNYFCAVSAFFRCWRERSPRVPVYGSALGTVTAGAALAFSLWGGGSAPNQPTLCYCPNGVCPAQCVHSLPSSVDTISPTVTLTAPAANTTVSGTVMITADASDNVGVVNVVFLVDGVVRGSDTSFPYSYSWDTTEGGTYPCVGVSAHILVAEAHDAGGNSGRSASVVVETQNPSYCANPPTSSCTHYVAVTGSDTNQGTSESAPWRTLQKAADTVQPGDVVCVRSGTYGGFLMNQKGSTTDKRFIVFKPSPGHEGGVTIDRYLVAPHQAVRIWTSHYIEMRGFKITDSHPEIKLNGVTPVGALDIYNSSHIRIVDNEIWNFDGNALSASGSAHEILNNNLHNIGELTKLAYGMYLSGSDYLIRGNRVTGAAGYGVNIYPTGDRFIFENNILHNNGRDDFGQGSSWRPECTANGCPFGAGMYFSGRDAIIRNNILYSNRAEGMTLFVPSGLVVNNTVYGNGDLQPGMYVYDNLNAVVQNNLSFQNAGGDYYIGAGNTQDHNLFGVDPKFVNPAAGDFHLQPGSPALDAGVSLSGFSTDFEGTPRPQGPAWDMGADEL